MGGCLCYNSFSYKQMPTPALQNISPFQKLFDKEPDYNLIEVFECLCFPYVPSKTKKKIQPKDINVYIPLLEEYVFHDMLFLMNPNFLLLILLIYQL